VDTKATTKKAGEERDRTANPDEEVGLMVGEDTDGSVSDAGILDVIIDDGVVLVVEEIPEFELDVEAVVAGTVRVVPDDDCVGTEVKLTLPLGEGRGIKLAEEPAKELEMGRGLGIDEEPGIGVILTEGPLNVGEEKAGTVKVVEMTLEGALATLGGTEMEEVSLETGESKSPVIPVRVKKGEY